MVNTRFKFSLCLYETLGAKVVTFQQIQSTTFIKTYKKELISMIVMKK